MDPVISALADVAATLAEIQIEGVRDDTGFSNADKYVGGFLAAAVKADPSNEENVRTLAALVSGYRRQSEGLVGHEMHERFKQLALDKEITLDDRARARHVILAKPNVHERFGPQVVFSWNGYSTTYSDALRSNGAKAFKDGQAWRWAVPARNVPGAVAALKQTGAEIVGSVEVPSVEGHPQVEVNVNLIEVSTYTEKSLAINWAYGRHAEWNEIARNLPRRTFNREIKKWIIPLSQVAIAEDLYRTAGADVSQFQPFLALAPKVEEVATPDEPDYFERVRPELFDSFKPYQVEGVKFLTRPLRDIRRELRSAEPKGIILGDDMGLGKTLQSIAAANAIAEPEETILVVCPATLKLNWRKEIRKWGFGEKYEDVHILKAEDCKCGHGGTNHKTGRCAGKFEIDPVTRKKIRPIVKTKKRVEKGEVDGVMQYEDVTIPHVQCTCTEPMQGGYDKLARWNIVNYDVLPLFYDQLIEEGFDILICDEAHYAKNRESTRSKLVVGAPASRKNKGSAAIKGLCEAARKRVFLLTGTPMTNRPRDIFQLLKGSKHPLSRNWKSFANRYCNPIFNGWGTTYDGGTNLEELREKISPIFLQRKKEDHLDLPPKMRNWIPVEVDLREYRRVMAEYEARREAGELSRTEHQLALITEARVCCATAKITPTIELIENAVEQGEKVLVFTGRTNVLKKIVAHFGEAAVKIDGESSQTDRQEAERAFMEDDSVRVIVGNIIAMGVGLNLTAGTQVIVNDLDFVPANHAQAEDRAYRIGQTKMVNVTYVLAAGTFDEDLGQMLNEKMEQITRFEGFGTTSLLNDLIAKLAEGPQNYGVQAIERTKSIRKNRAA